MAKLHLVRKSSSFDPILSGYRMILEIVSAEDITPKVFVNQRLRNFLKGTTEDVFAAVATSAQLEDLDDDAPAEGTTFFRSHKVEILSRNPDYLKDVYDDIVWELQKLCDDVRSLEVLTEQETIIFDSVTGTSTSGVIILSGPDAPLTTEDSTPLET